MPKKYLQKWVSNPYTEHNGLMIMKTRLRPAYKEQDLVKLYEPGFNSHHSSDHDLRIPMTSEMIKWLIDRENLHSVADLSAGDGLVVYLMLEYIPELQKIILGDMAESNVTKLKKLFEFVQPNPLFIHAKIEDSIQQIEPVDVLVLSETLEHIDNPEELLKNIRAKAKYLVLTTPNNEVTGDNPEHYWSWDLETIRTMLIEAGFEPMVSSSLNFKYLPDNHYEFQLWICK